jgi:EAL domain-containing protein (putative c-di-GMP-specific phosphodiesterase class I)
VTPENLIGKRYLEKLLIEKDILGALQYCAEDIVCYSAYLHQKTVGKNELMFALLKKIDSIPSQARIRFSEAYEKKVTERTYLFGAEYEMYEEGNDYRTSGNMTALIRKDADGSKILGIHTSGYEINQIKLEHQLHEYFFQQGEAFNDTDISYWYYDIANKRILHNEHSVKVHGFENVVENVPVSLIESGYVHPDSIEDFKALYQKLENGEQRATADIWIKPFHASQYWCERIVYTTIYSNKNEPIVAIGISTNVTSEKLWKNNKKLKAAALLDAVEKTDVLKKLEAAVDNGELEIFLQPKVHLKEKRIYGAESLIRWRDPEKGLLSPAEFVPKLESMGLAHILDSFAFASVCAYQKKRMARGLPLYPISSNLSMESLMNPECIQKLLAEAANAALPEGVMVLEVTETAFASNLRGALKNTEKLQQAGIRISMDDFGVGSSSFAQLASMPVDELKLDMKLVQNCTSLKGNAIIQSILKLTEWLNMPVVAEGMETKEQVAYLYHHNCPICQGYYFSKPLPLAEYEAYEASFCMDEIL